MVVLRRVWGGLCACFLGLAMLETWWWLLVFRWFAVSFGSAWVVAIPLCMFAGLCCCFNVGGGFWVLVVALWVVVLWD